MSGHSKWHSIKHKKGAADAKRGKIFTKHARLITIAAKNGADPATNPSLRAAIDGAKFDNVPNDNIDRAVKKGAGDNNDEAQLQEVYYEGFGPSGVAMMIHTVTDNRNRAVANVRSIMTKNSGNLGEAGVVAYMFEKKGFFLLESINEDAELALIELGVDDINENEVMVAPTEFYKFKVEIEKLGLKIVDSKLILNPKTTAPISDLATAEKLFNLIEKLEEDDDVVEVHTNADIPSDILDKL